MKVIFLDIDGVLNSTRSAVGLGRYGNPGCLRRGEDPCFDPVAVGLLRRLVERTGAKIVLSSTWRMGCEPAALAAAFEKWHRWQDAPVIGRTPFGMRLADGRRGHEIAAWLEAHPVDAYVILDDDSDMLPEQMGRFVKTSFNIGLTYDSIKQAAEVLGCPESRLVTISVEDPA